ncbi:hypothetical protein BGZ74_010460 [Mortierella antarctica]|nr:hypothetical protein BGZ74_010460 [Mortierella antarctica]
MLSHKLPLVLLLGWAAAVSSAPSNSTESGDDVCSNLWSRQECGFLGITKEGCIQRQCCWAPSMAPVPWCFQKKNEDYVCSADVVTRRDCGYLGIGAQECHDRNCCWDPKQNNLNAPYCFLRQHSCKGYGVSSATTTANGVQVQLDLNGGSQGCARFGEDIPRLKVIVDFETKSRVRVRILDRERSRYEIPASALPNPQDTAKVVGKLDYDFKYTENPFTFSVIRRSTGEAVFQTKVPGVDSLVYENEYLEISTALPDDANIYGLGEVVSGFRRDSRGTRQTMWARDAATPVDENVYGSHPFYLEMRNGTAHGVFLRNSNGMDVIISPAKLTYKVIGGIFDFTVFLGPSPADVINQYTELIGRPHMPPAWAMGFHQCRYGYTNIDQVETVVNTYQKEDLPLDGVWIDIDYMDKYKDFTFDELRFPESRVKKLAENLAATNRSMVLIVDPGIPVEPGYGPYDSGMAQDVFIKNKAGKPFEGRVWPGQTYFPDFFDSNGTWSWWERHLQETRDKIGPNVFPWIDMNEPSNFCNGECTSGQQTQNQPQTPSKQEATVNLKYSINNAGRQALLSEKTVSEDAVLKNGLSMYDTHNLYGHMEARATHQALTNLLPNTRPFILSRSTFPGTGSSAAHWTGDNWSEWNHLYFSIPGVLSFGLFGIPFTGSDICGFIGNTTEELCLRWHQLGALYPFARNHNTLGANPQEAYLWPTTVLPAARQALRIRYSLLPYYYTLFDRASRVGTPLWQPLFFQYSNDPLTLKIDHQFLLGDSVMVSPALYKGQIQVKAYFPGNGRWFNLWTHECIIEHDSHGGHASDDRSHRYKFLSAKADGEPIPMSIAGGHIIPIQAPQNTVADTRAQPVSLVIALDERGNAKGEVYVDDGRSLVNSDSARVNFEMLGGEKLVSSVSMNQDAKAAAAGQSFQSRVGHSSEIEKITILGLNFARAGGESGAKTVFKASTHSWKSKVSECHEERTRTGAHRDCGQRVLVDQVTNKVGSFLALNVNGKEVAVGGKGRTGKDDVLGYAWAVDETLGSLTLTGLKMDLFTEWFVQWKLD